MALFQKKSSTQLSTEEVSQVHQVIYDAIVERTKGEIALPFPNMEDFLSRDLKI